MLRFQPQQLHFAGAAAATCDVADCAGYVNFTSSLDDYSVVVGGPIEVELPLNQDFNASQVPSVVHSVLTLSALVPATAP